MINSTQDYGQYVFDFKNTDAGNEDRIFWLKGLALLLSKNKAFFTEFPTLFEAIKKDDLDRVTLTFNAEGYNTYVNNIRWFSSGALKEHLLAMPGIEITIFYKEFECNDRFLCRGIFLIKVFEGQILVEEKFYDTNSEGDFPRDKE